MIIIVLPSWHRSFYKRSRKQNSILMEISIPQITWRIMIIVLLALFGVAARRFKLIKEEACSSFTDVMINLTLPSLIFVTLTTEIKWGRLVEGVCPINRYYFDLNYLTDCLFL